MNKCVDCGKEIYGRSKRCLACKTLHELNNYEQKLENGKISRKKRRDGVDDKCYGCIHRRYVTCDQKGCLYILDTGHKRGCSAEECAKNKIHYERRK